MKRTRREEVNGRGIAYTITTWDDETGDAEILEFDEHDEIVRRGVLTYRPEEEWEEPVIGEAVWFDADGNETQRSGLKIQKPAR